MKENGCCFLFIAKQGIFFKSFDESNMPGIVSIPLLTQPSLRVNNFLCQKNQ